MGGYLVCEGCAGYYELQPGELPTDFSNKCECGGELKYKETIESSDNNLKEMTATTTCPYCAHENPEDAKLCQSCKRILKNPPIPPKSEKKQKSTNGISETWNEQSNGIKALSILSVCCIGLILIFGVTAMFSPDKNTQNLSQSPTSTTPTTSSTMSESDYASKAQSWAGTVGDALTGAGNDMNSYSIGAMTTQEIVSSLQGYKRTIDTVLGEEKATTPPAKFSNVHQLTISAEQDASNGLGFAITGAQTNNTGDITKATGLINSADTKFKKVQTELEQM